MNAKVIELDAIKLLKIFPFAKSRVDQYAPLLSLTMAEFQIDTPKRAAAFVAEIGHESGQLRYTEEIASGEAYEGRLDLGNTQAGDGRLYKGRGLIQITGRANYRDAGHALGLDLIESPKRLAEPELATRSAGWFWKSRSLNRYADTDAFGSLTKAINGGYNGIDDRIQLWLAARRVFEVF